MTNPFGNDIFHTRESYISMLADTRIAVAESGGVEIFAHEGIRAISLTNSTYYAHARLAALDMYQRGNVSVVLSPVEGRVVGIRVVRAPRPKYFKPDENEKLLLMANDSKLVTKILQIGPTVQVGEFVETLSPIGKYVWSGFFNFWTGNHLHVEVRLASDPIRARGSLPVAPALLGGDEDTAECEANPDNIPCEVVEASTESLLLKPTIPFATRLSGYVGLRVTVGKAVPGLLDGGFPHHGFGGIFIPRDAKVSIGELVRIGDLIIGETVRRLMSRGGLPHHFIPVKFKKGLQISLSESKVIRGLSLLLGLASPESLLL
jgi:hypothetical protein